MDSTELGLLRNMLEQAGMILAEIYAQVYD